MSGRHSCATMEIGTPRGHVVYRGRRARSSGLLAATLALLALGSAAAAQGTIAGTVELRHDSAQYLRTVGNGCTASSTPVRYTTVDFYVASPGSYSFSTTGNQNSYGHVADPLVTLYRAPFDPQHPTSNCLAANDDSLGSVEAMLAPALSSDAIYTAVISTYYAGAVGSVGWAASGEGDMFVLTSVTKLDMIDANTGGGTMVVRLSAPDSGSYVVTPSGTPEPSSAQVLAGQDAAGATSLVAGSIAIADAQAGEAVVLSGLAAASAYDVYVVANNDGRGSGVRRASFRTDPPPPPQLVSSLPAAGSTHVPKDSAIVLTFDQAMRFGSGAIRIVNDTASTSEAIDVVAPAGRLTLSAANSVLTIVPEAGLEPAADYHIEMDGGALIGSQGPFAGIDAASAIGFTTVAADLTPDPFAFTAITGAAPNSEHGSEPITVTGIDAPAPISVSAGLYSVNAGAPTSEPGSVIDGDQIVVFLTAASSYATTAAAILTIGDGSAAFEVITGSGNPLVVSEEFSGDNGHCLQGGVELRLGIDLDEDEALSSEELRQVAYVCNGRSAEVSSNPLDPDPTVCPQGGVEIVIEVPGIAISSEIPSSVRADLCHGSPSLVRTTSIDPGSDTCAAGGVQVETWLDLDADGEPGAHEVSSVQDVCHGLSSLVETTPLATDSPECATGGLRVRAGLDADGDGVLDDTEANGQAVLCHGGGALLETIPIEPNEECPSGGVVFAIGTDVDGDGTLQPEERTSERTLCTPPASVSRTLQLPIGSLECAYGGNLHQSGADADRDGTLDDAEVLSSELICNGFGVAIRSRPLAAGAECAGGGVWLETGIDADGDAVLGDTEVWQRDAVCSATPHLLATERIPEGERGCEHGGLRVLSGRDDGRAGGNAGDGTLQPGEVEGDQAVCDPSANGCSAASGPGARTASAGHWAALSLVALAMLTRSRQRPRRAQ